MLTEPIVEGAYYRLDGDGLVVGPVRWKSSVGYWVVPTMNGAEYYISGDVIAATRVYIVPTDPAEVVAELRRLSVDAFAKAGVYQIGRERAFAQAADLVAERLGVRE